MSADLSLAAAGDTVLLRVKVREIDIHGRIWCDSPFALVRGRYGALAAPPEVIAVEKRGSGEAVAAQVPGDKSREAQ